MENWEEKSVATPVHPSLAPQTPDRMNTSVQLDASTNGRQCSRQKRADGVVESNPTQSREQGNVTRLLPSLVHIMKSWLFSPRVPSNNGRCSQYKAHARMGRLLTIPQQSSIESRFVTRDHTGRNQKLSKTLGIGMGLVRRPNVPQAA